MTVKEFLAVNLLVNTIEELNDSIISTTKNIIVNSKDEIVAVEVFCRIESVYEESLTISYDMLVNYPNEVVKELHNLYDRVNEY